MFFQQGDRGVSNPLDGPQGTFLLVVAEFVPVLVGMLYGIQPHKNHFRVLRSTSLTLQDDSLERPAERLKIWMLRPIRFFDEIQQRPAEVCHGQVAV